MPEVIAQRASPNALDDVEQPGHQQAGRHRVSARSPGARVIFLCYPVGRPLELFSDVIRPLAERSRASGSAPTILCTQGMPQRRHLGLALVPAALLLAPMLVIGHSATQWPSERLPDTGLY